MGARFPRRLAIRLWTVVSMLACTLAGAPDSNAQAYPARPVTIIVPFGPGSGSDVAGRFFGDMYMWKRDADFRAAAFDSPAPAIAAGLMVSPTADFFYDQLFVKEQIGRAHV